MKVIVSLTSTPPRLAHLAPVLETLLGQACHEVWINIPRRYDRWPEWDGVVPDYIYNLGPKLVVNRDCLDQGPGTKYLGSVHKLLPEDLVIYVDDDTLYDQRLVMNLLKWHKTDSKSAWGLSGFNLGDYFKGHFPRQHGQTIDVVEGYGGVIVKAEWIQKIREEFNELITEARFADDIIISNLFAKHGIMKKTVHCQDCNLSMVHQVEHGFRPDALHNQTHGGHKQNYFNVLKILEDKGKYYFYYKCS